MSENNDTPLRRWEAAAFLKSLNLPVSAATLAKYASVGGGPEFDSFGRVPLYQKSKLREWAESRLRRGRRSTSDQGRAA